MDILFFGGAFDPVHRGHENILKAALNYKKFDKIIVMPTGTPGHKRRCRLPFALRKKMAEIAFDKICDGIEVSGYEGEKLGKSYSYITVDRLKEKYPEANVYFLIGGDSAIALDKWKNREYLQKNVVFLIAQREQNEEEELNSALKRIQKYSPNSRIIKTLVMPISSTELREKLTENLPAEDYIDRDVLKYIQENHLYSRDYYERNIGIAKRLIPLLLREKRAAHTKNVADLARKFAEKYGENPDKAYLAGLLHDIQKEADRDIVVARSVRSDDEERIRSKNYPVLHGFAAADFAKYEMGIDDPDLLMSLKSHTCGRPGMSTLEKIIYLADMLSRERDFPEKDYLLNLAWQDLDVAMDRALADSIKWLKDRGDGLDNDSVEAYNYFEAKLKNKL